MCATNLWALDRALLTPALHAATLARLGVAPSVVDASIVSRGIRDATVLTLTPRACDCTSLVGRLHDEPDPLEVPADAWLDWLRSLPTHAPSIARIDVLRTHDVAAGRVQPTRTRRTTADAVDERALRDVRPGTLLTIVYRPTAR